VRHAQGVHNIEGEKNYKAYMKPEYFDAPLTPLGWQQVRGKKIMILHHVLATLLVTLNSKFKRRLDWTVQILSETSSVLTG